PTLIFFLPDTTPPEIYTLSLHDALPISLQVTAQGGHQLSEFCSVTLFGHKHPSIGGSYHRTTKGINNTGAGRSPIDWDLAKLPQLSQIDRPEGSQES